MNQEKDDFKDWLNANRNANVSEIFHDVIAHVEALERQIAAPVAQPTELPELPEDESCVHIYPCDLSRMEASECTATVFSVPVGSPDGKAVPLYTANQVREYALAALAAAPVAQRTGSIADDAKFWEKLLTWHSSVVNNEDTAEQIRLRLDIADHIDAYVLAASVADQKPENPTNNKVCHSQLDGKATDAPIATKKEDTE